MAASTPRRIILMHLLAYSLVIATTLVLVKIVDILIPLPADVQTALFKPSQKAIYKTSEFEALTSINRFGFRGSEESLETGQVAVIGDSFTFGFGNGDNEAWPHLLQGRLADSKKPYKVYNLGLPGSHTLIQTQIAKKYVKELKPRVLIFSVLIGDDFEQVAEDIERQEQAGFRSQIRIAFETMFPSIGLYVARLRAGGFSWGSSENGDGSIPIATQTWKKESSDFMTENGLQFPADVVSKINAGDLNPHLLYLAHSYPERYGPFWHKALDSETPEARALVEIEKELKEVNRLVRESGGEMVMFAMPSPAYVRSEAFENYKKYGFKLSPDLLDTTEPEDNLAKLADRIGCKFVPSLNYFRSIEADMFFHYDGHLNPTGSQAVAEHLYKEIFQDTR